MAPHSGVAGAPRWVGARSHQWPDTEYVMGWDVLEEGLGVIFDPVIPGFVAERIRGPIEAFTKGAAVDAYALHPGGAKVLEAFESALGLDPTALAASKAVLREYGNMSSPTVLFVLKRILDGARRPGRVLASALGPGFSCESALLESASE